MNLPVDHTSFLVRFWREQDSHALIQQHLFTIDVEHIQSGQHRQFNHLEDLFTYLIDQVQFVFPTGRLDPDSIEEDKNAAS